MANVVKTVQIVVDAKDGASSVLKGIGGAFQTAIGTFAGGAALGLATKGFETLTSVIGDGMADARDAAKVFAQTQQVIKSTGGAAGFTADQIADMAGSLSAASGQSLFGDDDIQRGQNMLLTFTNIKGVLPDTTKMMLDMAQALGTDAGGAAVQLGKALNDPIKGISALSRVGVSFTKEQKAQIKAMQDAGNMAGAQQVILAELNKEFGGSAAAAARADGGMAQFADTMGELKESIGRAALPIMQQFMKILTSPAFLGGIQRVADVIINGLGAALTWLTETAIPNVTGAWADLTQSFDEGGIGGVLQNVLAIIGEWIPGLQPITDFLQAHFWPVWEAGAGIIDGLSDSWQNVVAAFQQEGIRAALQETMLALQFFGGEFLTTLASWGQALLEWIAPMIPPLLRALGKLASRFLVWIGDQAKPILAQLGDWAAAFVAWIGPATVAFLKEWPGMLNTFLDWIGTAAGPLLKKLGEWAVQFIAWIVPMIPGFVVALGAIAVALIAFIAETAIVLLGKLGEWGKAFGVWIGKDAIPALVAAWPGFLASLKRLMDEADVWATKQAASIGTAIVAGIKQGILDAWAGFKAWLASQLRIGGVPVGGIVGSGTPGGQSVIGQAVTSAGLRDALPMTLPSGYRAGRSPSVSPDRGVGSTRPALTVDLRGASFGAGLTEGQVRSWIAPVLDDALRRWESGLLRETTDLATRGALR